MSLNGLKCLKGSYTQSLFTGVGEWNCVFGEKELSKAFCGSTGSGTTSDKFHLSQRRSGLSSPDLWSSLLIHVVKTNGWRLH